MQVTGGMVAYEDGVKKAEDFAPAKKARVELKFDVAEGEDHTAALNHVSALAIAKTNEMIGLAASKPRAKPAAENKVLPHSKEADTVPASTIGKTKADLEREALAAAAEKTVNPPMTGPGGKGVDPAAVPMDDMIQTPAEPASAGIMDEDFSVEASAEISDQDLTAKANHASAKVGSVKVRTLVSKFNPDPSKAFSLKQIAQASRATFLEQLAVLS